MPVDLDRLHEVETITSHPRQCGRSYALIVEAMQLSEFVDKPIAVLVANMRAVNHVMLMARTVAHDLEYAPLWQREGWKLNGVQTRVLAPYMCPQRGIHWSRVMHDMSGVCSYRDSNEYDWALDSLLMSVK